MNPAQPSSGGTGSARRIAVVPVFNEEPTVIAVLERLRPLVDEIVVVDDGSVDRSRQLILEWASGHDRVQPILHEQNQGLSAAYYSAFSALKARVETGELSPDDLVITIDADGQHEPEDLDRLIAQLDDGICAAVVARRDFSGYTAFKRFGNWALSLWASLWAGQRLLDVESGFRVFRLGPLIEALDYYHGYRYSETVEVAVVLARLGYRISNDVVVPVPVSRSRTRLSDGIIDALAMVGAWWRVFAGRHRPQDMPAWTMYVFAPLSMLALLFISIDFLVHPLFLASDSMVSYSHVWYLSDQIFHHASIPLRVSLLDDGRAVTFPYAFGPYLAGAVAYQVFHDWAVTLLMVLAVLGTVWSATLVRPTLRDPWLILLFLLNPFFIDAIYAFQFASLWCAVFFFLFVWAFERKSFVPAAVLLWVSISSHPVIGSVAIAGYGLCLLALDRKRVPAMVALGVPVAIALIPIYWMTSLSPFIDENPSGVFEKTLGWSILTRISYMAEPFALAAIAPLVRRYYRPALAVSASLFMAGFLVLSAIIHYNHGPSGYYGAFHTSSDVYAEFFTSPAFVPGAHYRLLEPSEREDGMYRFIRHGAVLTNEFFTESVFHRGWALDQYACYASYKRVEYVVIEQAWYNRTHENEGQVLDSLVQAGQAGVVYTDPQSRFTVYDIRKFVTEKRRPDSLSECNLF